MKYAFPILLLALVGSGLALITREQASDSVLADLGGVKFAYTSDYARDETTAAGGLSDRLAFLVSFPRFLPPDGARDRQKLVKVTLTPADEGLDPRERPSKLYARFLTPEALEGPSGLVLRRFEAESPYDSEELFLAPPDGRSFFARCPKAQVGAPAEGCLSVFRTGPVDVELRYPPELLEHWDALYEGARTLLSRMQRRQPTGAAR